MHTAIVLRISDDEVDPALTNENFLVEIVHLWSPTLNCPPAIGVKMNFPSPSHSALKNVISLACVSVFRSAKCSMLNSTSLSKAELEEMW